MDSRREIYVVTLRPLPNVDAIRALRSEVRLHFHLQSKQIATIAGAGLKCLQDLDRRPVRSPTRELIPTSLPVTPQQPVRHEM
jgi:hypothetical protein